MNPLRKIIEEVTTNWSIATGRDLKAAVTAPSRIRTEIATSQYAPRRVRAPRVPQISAATLQVRDASVNGNGVSSGTTTAGQRG